MRFGCVCRVSPTQRPGGMPFVCQDRAEELARRGHDVHVLTTGPPGTGPAPVVVNGVSVHHLDCEPQVYSEAFAAGCRDRCRDLCPRVLHLDSADFARPWWENRPGGPQTVAVTLHGFETGAFLTRWNQFRTGVGPAPEFPAETVRQHARILGTTFDRVLAISLHEFWMLADVYGLWNVALVYNPIAPAFFARPPAPPPADGPWL